MMICGTYGMSRMISVAAPISISGITFFCINTGELLRIIVYGFMFLNDPEFLFSTEI